jgi:hypothetical protein
MPPVPSHRTASRYLTVVFLTAACLVSEAARAEEALSQAAVVESSLARPRGRFDAPSEQRLAVVREEDAPSEELAELDRELISVLAAREDLPTAQFSPVPFSELALTAECHSGTADCLQRIARRLEYPWLILRMVERERSGSSRLTLMAPDPFIASVALLVSGSIVGGLAVRERNTYEELELRSVAEVDRAAELRDSYEDRTGWARGLWAGAAVSGALGASLLLWDRLTERNHASLARAHFDASGVRLAATPVAGGAGIWLSGTLQPKRALGHASEERSAQ